MGKKVMRVIARAIWLRQLVLTETLTLSDGASSIPKPGLHHVDVLGRGGTRLRFYWSRDRPSESLQSLKNERTLRLGWSLRGRMDGGRLLLAQTDVKFQV